MLPRLSVQAGGQQARRHVAAHIAGHAGRIEHRRAQQRVRRVAVKERQGREGRGGDGTHRQSGKEVLHDGVARHHHPPQGIRRAGRIGKAGGHQLRYLPTDAAGQLCQAVRLVQGVLDTADDVRAVGCLHVPGADGLQLPGRGQVVEPHGHRGRAQVHGGGTALLIPAGNGDGHRVREDRAAGRLRQRHHVAVGGNGLAGQAGHAVDRHPAFAAPPPAAAGGRDGEPCPAQRRQQRFAVPHRHGTGFAAALHLNA